jgi:heat shock protein HslJ
MKYKLITLVLLVMVGVFPAMAQDSSLNQVTFNGFGVSFDSTLATNANIWQYAGDAPDLQQPGGAEPPFTQFNLYTQQPAPESAFDAPLAVRFYHTADIAAYTDSLAQVQALQTLIAQRPDLASYMVVPADNTASNALPFLPVAPASQVIRAKAEYIDTPAFQGVRYITVYRQDVSPFLNNEFFYTFQGLSPDGTTYVSAIFKIVSPDFPAELGSDFNYETFSADFMNYLTESVDKLNNAAPEAFNPVIPALDAVVQTLTATSSGSTGVEVPPVEATASDPTLGGLAGTVWTLISYGPADAPIAAAEGTSVTAAFSEQGIAGNAGCNSYSGPFQYSENSITFGAIISTLMACLSEEITAQEGAYLAALGSATSFAIVDGQLQITYDGGVLTFQAAA